jgi:hypothetical protein
MVASVPQISTTPWHKPEILNTKVNVITLPIHQYNNRFLPFLMQIFLIPNKNHNSQIKNVMFYTRICTMAGNLYLSNFPRVLSTTKTLGSCTSGSGVCISVSLISFTQCIFNNDK